MRYNKLDIISKEGRNCYKNKTYPFIPPSETDVYLISSVGDRLDLYANIYYKDPSLWWVIAMSNNLVSMFPKPGTQIRIPVDLGRVMNIFDKAN